jgi:hypothetical protein
MDFRGFTNVRCKKFMIYNTIKKQIIFYILNILMQQNVLFQKYKILKE